MEQDVMQPTLLMIHKVIYITVHVDDVLMVGDEGALKQFVDFLKVKKRWSIEEGTVPDGRKILLLEEKFHALQELVRHQM